MSVASLRDQVVAIVTEFAPEAPVAVDESSDFIDDLGYHSLALVELSFAIEDAFDLDPITADDVENVHTIGDLVEFLRGRVAA